MVILRKQCVAYRGVFYVFPLVGTTFELSRNPDVLAQSWLLDIFDLPDPPPFPTTKSGSPRKSGFHYVDVTPPNAAICSEPFQVPVINAADLLENEIHELGAVNMWFEDNFQAFMGLCRALGPDAFGAVVLPQSTG